MSRASWLVETAIAPVADGGDWEIHSGYDSEESARATVRQLRYHYARKGRKIRARYSSSTLDT